MLESTELLLEEQAYSGKVYRLTNPKTSDLSLGWVREKLDGREIKLGEEFDLEDRSDLEIPEVFRPDSGSKPNQAKIQNVSSFNKQGVSGIIGYVKHNQPDTVTYEGKEVFILESQRTIFSIFNVNDECFLSMIGSRKLVNAVLDLISEVLDDLGLKINEIHITHEGFEEIAENMVDSLKITTISGYASPNIDKKVVQGSGYGNDDEYLREERVGTVSGQQFGTQALPEEGEKTIQISEDGLIRSYSKVKLSSYIGLIGNYILDSAQYQTQSSLTQYLPEDSRA